MIATYLPLFLAMVALLKFRIKVPLGLAALSIVMALLSGLITPIAILPIVLLGLVCYGLQSKVHRFIPPVCVVLLFVLGCVFMLHKAPGFNNPKLIDGVQLDLQSIAFTMYLNFDKAIMGLLLLIFLPRPGPSPDRLEKNRLLSIVLMIILVTCVGGMMAGVIDWSVKWPAFFGIWALSNLFITSVVEEAFFRGFIQYGLQKGLDKVNKPQIIAVILSAVLFGLIHAGAGLMFMLLAMLVGFGYGYVFYKTGKLRFAIAFHFGFNVLHLLLFSYPKLSIL